MHGNAWEWCEDYFGKYVDLPKGNNQIQTVKQSEDGRVLRGGDWGSNSWNCRSAYRRGISPDDRSIDHGFRVAALP